MEYMHWSEKRYVYIIMNNKRFKDKIKIFDIILCIINFFLLSCLFSEEFVQQLVPSKTSDSTSSEEKRNKTIPFFHWLKAD